MPSDTWTEHTLRSYLESSTNNPSADQKLNLEASSVGISGVIPQKAAAHAIPEPSNENIMKSGSNPGFRLFWDFIKLLLLAVLFLSPLLLDSLPIPYSIPTWLQRPTSSASEGPIPSIHLWLPSLVFIVMGLPFAFAIINIAIWSLGSSSPIGRPKDRQPSLFRSRLRYILSVSKKYLALFLFVSSLLICVNVIDIDRIFQIPPDGPRSAQLHVALNKLLLALMIGTLLFAYKNYAVVSMAMAFNYANYIVRIRESIFSDRMLVLLEDAAKSHYKMKKRLSSSLHVRSDNSRLASIFESPRKALVSAGMLKPSASSISVAPNKNPIIDVTNTSAPNISTGESISPSPESPILSIPAPTTIPQISMMEPVFNPLQMQLDLTEFNRLAQRISTTFTSGPYNSYEVHNSFFKSGNNIMTYTPMINTDSKSGPNSTSNQRDYRHQSELRRHALHRSFKIFKWLAKETLTLEELKSFLQGSSCSVDIEKFWSSLVESQRSPRASSNKFHITSTTLADFIERSYLEVVSVSDSLSSMEAAVANLNLCLSIICLVLLLVFLALLFGDFLAALTSVSSLIFGAAFMFGSSAKNIFESIIFLFVVHPFDIGDRVFISLSGGIGPAPPITIPAGGALFTNASPGSGQLENLIVLQMHLMTTVFERWDGAKIYVPNYVLASKPIINVRRSGSLFDRHYIQIGYDTPNSSLIALRSRIANFLAQERNDFTNQFLLNVEFLENVNRMHLVILVQHRSNWQDLEAQLARRTKLLLFIKETMEELHIQYVPPIQRIELCPASTSAPLPSTSIEFQPSSVV